MTKEQAIQEIEKAFEPAFANYIITALTEGATASDKAHSAADDLAVIHTQGLDEGIRCAMCTNSMKSGTGCDGGCRVNDAMYKAVMDTIRNHLDSNICMDNVIVESIKNYTSFAEESHAYTCKDPINALKEKLMAVLKSRNISLTDINEVLKSNYHDYDDFLDDFDAVEQFLDCFELDDIAYEPGVSLDYVIDRGYVRFDVIKLQNM